MADIRVLLSDKKHIENLINGLKFASNSSTNVDDEHEGTDDCSLNGLNDQKESLQGNVASTSTSCLTCKCEFLERDDQVAHYRSDWHRYNLKLRLKEEAAINENMFAEIADSLSISGSESEESSDEEIIDQVSISLLKSNLDESVKFYDDRRPKFYFETTDNKIVSMYKKVLCNKQADVTVPTISGLMNTLLDNVQNCYWLIILFNAGHFATAVFDGKSEVLVHKTFHRYIVRAKRGTVQSLNDKSNRGHTAKSAGASLRRHNEAALEESITSLMNSWKEEFIAKCSHIFVRIPTYRKPLFYGGKQPLFDHNDERLRSIPFVTRRPTFNELKRVHKELFCITLHGETSLSNLLFQHKTNRQSPEKSLEEIILENGKDANVRDDLTDNTMAPVVEENVQHDEGSRSEVTIAFKTKSKKKRKTKDGSKAGSPKVTHEKNETNQSDDTVQLTVTEQRLLEKLYTACKTTDMKMFQEVLDSQFDILIQEQHTTTESIESSEEKVQSDGAILSTQEWKRKLLSHPLDKSGDTLLHVVSRSGDKTFIVKLLESGADPAVKNKSFQAPYCVCSNKEAKNTYRRFRAKYPDTYDYNKAQVASPLTEEIEAEAKKKLAEKKRAQKATKREKEKKAREEEKRQQEENERRLEEQSERDRFLLLSDREKRLIAVERRLANQPHVQLTQTRRCYTCAESLFAKVPFEYMNFQFCSVNCLKLHKAKNKS